MAKLKYKKALPSLNSELSKCRAAGKECGIDECGFVFDALKKRHLRERRDTG